MAKLTAEDEAILNVIRRHQEGMISSMIKRCGGEYPNSAKEVEAMNGVLTSMSKTVFDKVKARQEEENNKTTEVVRDSMLSFLEEMHKRRTSGERTEKPSVKTEEYKFSPDELSTTIDNTDLKKFEESR